MGLSVADCLSTWVIIPEKGSVQNVGKSWKFTVIGAKRSENAKKENVINNGKCH